MWVGQKEPRSNCFGALHVPPNVVSIEVVLEDVIRIRFSFSEGGSLMLKYLRRSSSLSRVVTLGSKWMYADYYDSYR